MTEEDGLLRLEIIKLVRESEGMTLTELAEKTGETRYKISKEVYNLVGLMHLEIIKIGNYDVVRVK